MCPRGFEGKPSYSQRGKKRFSLNIWESKLSSVLLNMASVYNRKNVSRDKSRGLDEPCLCDHDIWLWKRQPCLSDCAWGCILSNESSWRGCCTANGFLPCKQLPQTTLCPLDWKATWAACSNRDRGTVEWMSETVFLLLRGHCDRGFFIIECVSWSLGQRRTTVPWWAGPGFASSSIMQGMARAITRTALSLLLCFA